MVPVALYQAAFSRGLREQLRIRHELPDAAAAPTMPACTGRPQATSSGDRPPTCGSAITTQASRGRASDAELHRQRAHAHAGVALDGLEVVERHDAVRADAVEQRRAAGCASPAGVAEHDGGAGEPGQALVADADGGVAPPAVLLQPERRRAVGPGERQARRRRRRRPTGPSVAATPSESAVQTQAM